jgi:hypothetical protein
MGGRDLPEASWSSGRKVNTAWAVGRLHPRIINLY